ncbi:S8 family serine peptidase [bacterium]|nr:S8 family serine peptidase [bacterium]
MKFALKLVVVALAIAMAANLSCSRKSAFHHTPDVTGSISSGLNTPSGCESGDAGTTPIPGAPTLMEGAKNAPNPDIPSPLPRETAQAGIDFASNRFVVIFENSPTPEALAQYLSNEIGGGGDADAVLATDNAPLVDHPYYRKVSANLAEKYGLEILTRVFYKDVNYVALAGDFATVGDLDKTMLKVLRENKGLVREVCYDVYLHAISDLGDYKVYDDTAAEKPISELSYYSPSRTPAPGGFKFMPRFLTGDVARTPSAAPNDPMHLNKSGPDGGTWANWRTRAVDEFEGSDGAWKKSIGSSNVIVAVCDTGVRYTHEDLVDNTINPTTDPPYNGPGILTDVINKDNNPMDDHWHGTACSGCVGARGNNAKGLAGMSQIVTILPIKVLSGGGSGSDSQVAEGMLLADYLGANILSLSLGGPFPDRTTQLATEQCWDDGRLVVIAAGNENTDAPHYPGYYPDALSVGATTLVNGSNNQDFSLVGGELPVAGRFDARASFSNYGDWVDIAAPGIRVRSTFISSDSAYITNTAGTSFACPYVAGCAALLWAYISEQGGTPTNVLVRQLLQGSGTDMTLCNGSNPKGFKDNTSNGLVKFCNVRAGMDLYDAGGSGGTANITWDNPVNNDTVTGTEEIRVSVSGNTGDIIKVEFETPTRHLGSTDTLDSGFYKLDWDTAFEFNKPVDLTATVWDDDGNRYASTITVTPSNTHETVAFLEDFTGVADNAIPTGWYLFDGNKGTGSTKWGADTAQFADAEPSMHSSGTTTNYAASSNDWLYAPIIDLSDQAAAELAFQRRYQMGSGDESYVLITPDDMTYWGDIFQSTSLKDWAEYDFDLSQFAGREVRILWVLQANGSGQSVGFWLDDVAVTGTSGTPPTVSITSPSNGAQVNGRVTVNLNVGNVDRYRVIATPPDFGGYQTYDISTTDTTASFYWDSRYTYSGGVLLTVLVFDNDTEDGLTAYDSVALTVNNTTRNPNHFDGFEDISTLGGFDGSNFDGDWFVWDAGNSTDKWRIWTTSPYAGTKCARFGPSGAGNYGTNNNDRLYGPVHNPGSSDHPMLRFYHKLDLGTGDVAKAILVRYDGTLDKELILGEYRSDVSSWTEVIYDLTGFKNDPFRILYQFRSNNDGGVGTGWYLDNFELINADPVITSIVDPSGARGKTVTINGSGFGRTTETGSVTFAKEGGGLTSPTVNSWSASAIEVVVPNDAVSGNVVVTVLGYVSNGKYFGVSLPPPNLTGLVENR